MLSLAPGVFVIGRRHPRGGRSGTGRGDPL